MNTQQSLQLAFQHLNGGNLEAAGQLFNLILKQEPQNFAALNGRGFIALQKNALWQAQSDLQASLSVNPKQPFANKMLGIVLGAQGHFEAAMQAFAAALALDARDAEVYFNRANFLFQAGHVEEALSDLDACIKLRGSYLEARSNRANLLIAQGDYVRAEKDLEYLASKVPNNANIWVALGLVRHKLGKHLLSMQCNERALKLDPNNPDALLNSSSAAYDQGDFEAALLWAKRAVSVTPTRPEASFALANAHAALGSYASAVTAYGQALQLNPLYVDALNGRGLAYANLRHMNLAIADYDRAISIRPDFTDAIYNKSYIQLENHDFESGFAGFDLRFAVPSLGLKINPDLPIWHGEALTGRLLVRSEQGLGDQILFASVFNELECWDLPGVCVQVAPKLVSLFKRAFPAFEIISDQVRRPRDVVAQIPFGSLPKFFRKNHTDFSKAKVPYLFADATESSDFRKRFNTSSKKIVGVSWKSFAERHAQSKSLKLKDLGALFNLNSVECVDLQYGETRMEKLEAAADGISFNDSFQVDLNGDLDTVASIMAACDYVVTVSNTTAHLAGAMGLKVLLLLPYRTGKLWYWSDAKRSGSIWYPTVKTFHQSEQGDWTGTILDVVKYLQQ